MRFNVPRPAFGAGPRLSFGQRPAADGPPAPHIDRATARRTAQLAEAARVKAQHSGPKGGAIPITAVEVERPADAPAADEDDA